MVLLILSCTAAALAVTFLIFQRNSVGLATAAAPELPYDLAEAGRPPVGPAKVVQPIPDARRTQPDAAGLEGGLGGEPLPDVGTATAPKALPALQDYPPTDAPGLDATEDIAVQQLDHRGQVMPTATRIGAFVTGPGRSAKVAVVNFWATWCKPCIKELPEFKRLFSERPQWADRVAFVAVNTNDEHNLPANLARFQPTMPNATVFLFEPELNSERAGKALMRDRIAADTNLPVTLVTDCRGRVRWAARRGLDPEALNGALAKTVDDLLAEVDDPNKCPRCGDGKCTAGERCAAHSCWRDCLAECRTNGKCDDFAGEAFPAHKECPCTLPVGADAGVCALDKVCEKNKGEHCANSPLDCACKGPREECRTDRSGPRCRTKLRDPSKVNKKDL